MKNTALIFFCFILFSCSSNKEEDRNNTEKAQNDTILTTEIVQSVDEKEDRTDAELKLIAQGFQLITDHVPFVMVDLKYATEDNFTKKILYQDLRNAYLHPLAIQKLKKAQELLKEYNPNYNLLVYDAARPLSIQKLMYDEVKNTRYHLYVAAPGRTSLHNYGLAVDLTISNKDVALDMGTPFDYFGKEAGIYREDEFLDSGIFTKEQVDNRRLLRNVMTQAGFQPIRGEWWHFNACSLSEAKERFQIIE